MKKALILSVLFYFCGYINAQEKWTLDQCIKYATANNIQVKQQALTVENAKTSLSTSRNSRLPDLNANVGHQYNFGRVASVSDGTFVKSTAMSSSTDGQVVSYTPIFTGFRIPNQIKADKLNLLAAIQGLQKAKENLELQITTYYLDVLFNKEILNTYIEQTNISKQQIEKTQILLDGGKVPLSQLYDAKAQLAKDELNVTNAQNNLDLSLLNLKQSLNLTRGEFDVTEPTLGDVIADNIKSILPPSQIYQTAINIKPQVKEAEYTMQGNERLVKVAQAGYYPTLQFGASYYTGFNHSYAKGAINDGIGSQMNDNSRESFGLSLSIPIFTRFEVRNKVRAARIQVENSRLEVENVKLNLFKEIQQAYQNAIAAQAKFESAEKSLSASEESAKYAQDKYDVGKSTVYEYNEVQTKLLSSKSDLIQAKYDFLFRAKILDFYSGIPISLE